MASFPTSIISTAGLVTPLPNNPTNAPSHTGAHVLINGEIIAIETTLGINPQGAYATVSAALTTQGTLITAAQTTANAAVITANTAVTAASAAQSTANTAVTLANTAQTTANARATYPGSGVPNSTGSAWSTSYTVGTAANNLLQLNATPKIPAVDGSLLTNVVAAVNANLSGNQVSAAVSKNINTIYQAATDGDVYAYAKTNGAILITLTGVTDSSSSPSTLYFDTQLQGATVEGLTGSMKVKKGNYYQVTGSITSYLFVPSGS